MKNSTKKLSGLFLLLSCILFLCNCNDDDDFFGNCPKGDIITRTLTINGFTGIELELAADVQITQGNEFSVVAEGHEGIIDLLELEVQNDVWEIDLSENCNGNYQLDIRITMPVINSLKIDGSGNIEGQNNFEVETITLGINGSGNIQLDLDATSILADIDGSGNMTLEGLANVLDLQIDGSGNFGNYDLIVDDAIIDIDGSGDVSLTANNSLNVDIAGSGDVNYKGNPTIDVTITGSGKVNDGN